MTRFRNKKAVVEILDVEGLRNALDRQIGVECVMRHCEYTETENRNTFLKSTKDSWQDEFRLFWKDVEGPMQVLLPPGTARDVTDGL